MNREKVSDGIYNIMHKYGKYVQLFMLGIVVYSIYEAVIQNELQNIMTVTSIMICTLFLLCTMNTLDHVENSHEIDMLKKQIKEGE